MIGASLRRREDARFLTGRGRYVADLHAPGEALHAAFLRSPHAHARLVSLDASAARAAPGVRLVLTGADLPGWGTLPVLAPPDCAEPLRHPPRPALVRDRARFAGEPVALVVAETEAAARDAAEAVEAGWEALPAVADAEAALRHGAPQLHGEAPGNLAFVWRRGDRGAVRAEMAGAAFVARRRVPNRRVSAFPLEARAAVARPVGDGFELLLSGQGVHGIRDAVCAATGLDPARLRVVAPDVGGGFGLKNVAFPEHLCLLRAAELLGAPVRWVATTSEDMAGSAHGRGLHADAALALDAGGRFLALEVDAVAEMGAYLSAYGPWCPSQAAGTAMGGAYAVPLIAVEVRGAFSNTAPTEAYRGAGKPEANFLMEALVEAAAGESGIPAHRLREINALRPPLRTAMGMEIRDGDVAARLAECARLADRDGFPARRAASAARGRLRGFGLTCFLETARGSPGEWAGLSVAPDGSVTLAVGTQSNGQGHETSFPQYAAALLDLPPDAVAYVQADTALVPRGHGHGGARSLHQGGEAIRRAAAELMARARTAAARLLQADPGALHYAGGGFSLPDGRGVALAQIAAEEGDLSAEAAHDEARVTFPNGAHAAEVEVDPETGEAALVAYTAVDDYGRLLNPLLTRGSVMGGLAQGIGQALMERVVYEGKGAQLLTAGLMDYAIPRASDLPDLRVELREDQPTEANGLGAKGSGQAGAIAAPQAVMAALRDALGGGREVAMPATPEAVWRALRR